MNHEVQSYLAQYNVKWIIHKKIFTREEYPFDF